MSTNTSRRASEEAVLRNQLIQQRIAEEALESQKAYKEEMEFLDRLGYDPRGVETWEQLMQSLGRMP